MKAAVFHGPRDIRFEEVEKPTLEEGEVLVRVRACGICGSDLHTYRHGMFQEVLGLPVEAGCILGHEFSGEVAEIRGDVAGVEVGDRVVTVSRGANAEYVKISQPETELLKSSAKTIVVDLSDKRLAMATELGADMTINATKTDVVLQMMGSGHLELDVPLAGNVDAVFDCAGIAKSFEGTSVLEQALSIVKEDGKVIIVAVFEKSPEIEWNLVVRKGIRLFGSWAWTPEELAQASRLISSGRIDRKPLISHSFSLEDADKAYETQLQEEEAIKVVLTP